ncbi:MAG: hypothetical protein IPM34_10400 [Saprospiraceae bacterium]|nr:hypothetical protein [Saprospiraceae bacterium]
MNVLSSSLTVVLRIFIPVFWFVFFGSLCLFSWFTDDQDLPLRDPFIFRVQLTVFFFVGLSLILVFLLPLKRIEIDGTSLYITNYFKTIKIPLQSVVKISEKKFISRSWITLHLDFNSTFGKNIKMVCNADQLKLLKEEIRRTLET